MPVLAFVHGLSGSSRWFGEVTPLLGGRRTRLLDLPRFGRGFGPDAAADWVADALADEDAVDLVGHSLGGLVAARVAAERPELVRSLVLVAPVGAPRDRGSAVTAARYGAALARTLAQSPAGLLRTIATDALRWGPEALARGGIWVLGQEFAGHVQAPTLLVWGAQDLLVPPAQAEAWQRLVPHARIGFVPDAGHVPMVEAPSAFAQLLLDFLDDPSDGARAAPVDRVRGVRDDHQAPLR